MSGMLPSVTALEQQATRKRRHRSPADSDRRLLDDKVLAECRGIAVNRCIQEERPQSLNHRETAS